MHSDSYTLYFSSNYHIGMGGYDIFYSKMDGKSKEFTKPKNLGNPINTPKDEHGFIVSRDGDKAYFGSNEKGKDLNIFSFELYEEARPKYCYWTVDEHKRFLFALEKFGKNWQKVTNHVGTRTYAQVLQHIHKLKLNSTFENKDKLKYIIDGPNQKTDREVAYGPFKNRTG